MTMNDWLEGNNHYLEASLRWLRLRLERLIPEEPILATTRTATSNITHTRPPATPGRLSRWVKGAATAKKEPRLLTEAKLPSLDEQIEQAAVEREKAANIEPPPALMILSERFALSTFERDTLLLCAAMEFDPTIASVCSRAHGNTTRAFPTFGLALSLFDDPSWDALSANRPLRYARLIEINQPGATPLTSSALRADERIVNFLKGLNLLDERLASLIQSPSADEEMPLAASQQALVEAILKRLNQSATQSALPIVQLVGADTVSRLAVGHAVCAAVNRRLYRMTIESLPSQIAEIETLARLWQRETLLLPVALYIDVENLPGHSPETLAALHRFLSGVLGVVFLGVSEAPLRLSNVSFPVDVNKPTPEEQCEAWAELLSEFEPEAEMEPTPQMLAGQFNLSLGDIREAASVAEHSTVEGETIQQRVWDACRDLTRPRLDSLAQRLEPKATWDDLVLADEPMGLLRQIAGQVRERHKVYEAWGFSRVINRGFGISALFAGESGTGKTMAAEVIANDLRLNLYRIDLSAVVSKYIGETEKNLRKLFDAAERGGAILFFDEADALFGKRSEVKDSHDRYANIEVNYLLQRMEAFSGLAILATNMKGALDSAFMRRLRFIVNLPFPGLEERRLIWEKALPPETPRTDLDYKRLARLNISGGNIHSIALNAAFLAAQNGQTVTMPILLSAARAELRKLEKPINDAEFRLAEAGTGKP